MTEPSPDVIDNMDNAVRGHREDILRTDFEIDFRLPENLAELDAISKDFFWSWHPEGATIFRDLDPVLWDKYEQNPRLLLKCLSELSLWQRACDADYVAKVNRFAERFKRYMSE